MSDDEVKRPVFTVIQGEGGDSSEEPEGEGERRFATDEELQAFFNNKPLDDFTDEEVLEAARKMLATDPSSSVMDFEEVMLSRQQKRMAMVVENTEPVPLRFEMRKGDGVTSVMGLILVVSNDKVYALDYRDAYALGAELLTASGIAFAETSGLFEYAEDE